MITISLAGSPVQTCLRSSTVETSGRNLVIGRH